MARPLDPFRILELPRDATLDDVKAAYRRLAKLYHPDSAGERALPRFLAVQAAYEALTEGPGRLRAVIGGRPRSTTGRPGRPSPDAGIGRSTGPGPRGTRTTAPGGAGAPGARPGSRAGSAAGGAAGFSGSAHGDGAAGAPHGGSSRTRDTTGSRPRRTRRPPGSTSYDGAEKEPFEPEWEGASWYGGSSGTYWTINPREFADPRKHGPEYLARGRAGASRRRDGADADGPTPAGRGPARPRRARPGDGRPAGQRGGPGSAAWAQGEAYADRETGPAFDAGAAAHDDAAFAGDEPWADDAAAGQAGGWFDEATEGPPWSPRRSAVSDVSASSLIAATLLALAVVAALFVIVTEPATPGAASVVPAVAFGGIAIVVLVRVLRRDGRPRA
jgi:curved DNA-binding protein CbpA